MQIECFTHAEALSLLTHEWEILHARSSMATLFNSPLWSTTWWRHFGTSGALRLVTVRETDGTLVGILPLYATSDPEPGQESLRLLGGMDVSDYLDVLVAPGYTQDVIDRALRLWIDKQCSGALDLLPLPSTSPTREAVMRTVDQLHLEASSDIEDVCPVVTLPTTWQDYLTKLKKKDRHELRRKMRKAVREADVTWYSVRQWEEVAKSLPTFFRLHRASTSEKSAFLTPQMQEFFTEIAIELARRDWLWLAFLLINGEPAASYLMFDYKEDILVYNSGFNPLLAGDLSPGWVLLAYLIEEAIGLGRKRFDFLRGDEDYKFRFGAQPEPVYRLQVTLT